MNNTLILFCDGALASEVELGDRAVEVGSSADADLHIADPEVPERALLIHARSGTVWLHQLGGVCEGPQLMPIGQPIALGARHQVVRYSSRFPRNVTPAGMLRTIRIEDEKVAPARFTLLVGRPGGVRRIEVSDRPITIGTARSNDVTVGDPTVSKHHCRFDPEGGTLAVRDLGSTNGTWVRGVRVNVARLETGAKVRVGRTDVTVIAARRDADSEDPSLVVASPAMQAVLGEVQALAPLRFPVLLTGPSGSGKEVLAAAIHRQSPRKSGPFVALNAGGLARELVESELFGHEKGAFTGALAQRKGVFEQAEGGTLFLDEIGELPIELQTRLLRVLETWQVRRVGGERAIDVDVRLVCATHRDLLQMVELGTFREDLYFRLAHLVIAVPPLVDRPEDISALAEHFLRAFERDVGRKRLSRDAHARLLAHAWPGNARELRNVLCSACATSASSVLEALDIDAAIERISGRSPRTIDANAIERAMTRYAGNLSAVSKALAIPRTTLRDRLKRSGKKAAE